MILQRSAAHSAAHAAAKRAAETHMSLRASDRRPHGGHRALRRFVQAVPHRSAASRQPAACNLWPGEWVVAPVERRAAVPVYLRWSGRSAPSAKAKARARELETQTQQKGLQRAQTLRTARTSRMSTARLRVRTACGQDWKRFAVRKARWCHVRRSVLRRPYGSR